MATSLCLKVTLHSSCCVFWKFCKFKISVSGIHGLYTDMEVVLISNEGLQQQCKWN